MNFWDKLKAAFGDQVLVEEDTQLEQYCRANFKEVPKIAYTNKRDIKTVDVDIYLNELITPGAFEVDKLWRGVYPSGTNTTIARIVGNKVSYKLEWRDDINLANSGDYYLYPNETLALGWGDCEDHAFVCMSCHRELGGAWGLYDGAGHAFNVFVDNNQLYIMDATGDGVHIEPYVPGSKYSINYIITRRYTFQVKGGVSFGEVAQW